jgi:hypothetical protein
VKIGSSKSTPLHITHVVPQGSILSPHLFSIYTNDLPTAVVNSHCLESFVDDSKIFLSFSVQDKSEAKAKLEEDLTRITSWCCTNSLLINPEKTKFMLFGSPALLRPFTSSLSFLGKTLFPVFSAKDLGVTLDAYMKFDEHISLLVSKCMANWLCQIRRIRHLLDHFDKVVLLFVRMGKHNSKKRKETPVGASSCYFEHTKV